MSDVDRLFEEFKATWDREGDADPAAFVAHGIDYRHSDCLLQTKKFARNQGAARPWASQGDIKMVTIGRDGKRR